MNALGSTIKTAGWLSILSLFLFPLPSLADYVATGPFKANVCRGIGIEVCSFKPLHAVKGEDGRLYTISTRFETVTEYRGQKCWIRTKSKGGGMLSWGVNAVTQPEFYERLDSGEFKKHDVEYVVFPCIQR